MKVCNVCKGSGHDSNSTPEMTRTLVQLPDDPEVRVVYKTKAQGSGCMRCQGRGVLTNKGKVL